MPFETVTVNSRKYDGTIRRSWTCELIGRSDDLLRFIGVFDRDVEHDVIGTIRKGTVSYEYFPLDRWFNVFRFHEPSGTFRNFYCNINIPPTFEDGVVDYVDLDIDIVVWPDFSFEILDRDEFAANAAAFGYPPGILSRVDSTLAELLDLIESRKFPFDRTEERMPHLG